MRLARADISPRRFIAGAYAAFVSPTPVKMILNILREARRAALMPRRNDFRHGAFLRDAAWLRPGLIFLDAFAAPSTGVAHFFHGRGVVDDILRKAVLFYRRHDDAYRFL